MMTSKKSQSAFEFILVVAIMVFLVFLLLGIVNARITEVEAARTIQIAEEISDMVIKQHHLITRLSEGISTEFIVPEYYSGREYEISIIDDRELVVVYQGYEYVTYLKPDLVTPAGPIYPIPWGRNTITKQNDIIYLNP